MCDSEQLSRIDDIIRTNGYDLIHIHMFMDIDWDLYKVLINKDLIELDD